MKQTPIETDLLVIGGGINGTAIAADAAGRGLSVVLCEKGDLAQATSSASTKLIHGGLRYLEHFDFKLVHEALREREILLQRAPYLVKPMEFVLPHEPHLRPVWMIRLGLFLYDHLIFRSILPVSKKINLKKVPEGNSLKSEFEIAFTYPDCQTDDARLVILNAQLAQQHAAKILTRTQCITAKRIDNRWHVECLNVISHAKISIFAKAIVNATGPWVVQTLEQIFTSSSDNKLQYIQGSHCVIPKLYEGNHAFILQQIDGRIIFVIPYQNKFSLIGTTEVNFRGNLDHINISSEEIDYLINCCNNYFIKKIKRSDILWSYSGVRALYDNPNKKATALTREYHLEIEDIQKLPLISVFGGKLTTHRSLAEQVLNLLKPYFSHIGQSWTANTPFPGAENHIPKNELIDQLLDNYPWLPHDLVCRYVINYGELAYHLLGDAKNIEDLGRHFGAYFYEKEIKYLIQNEWALTLEDLIWRRTKLGLLLTAEQKKNLECFLFEYSN